MTVRIIHLPVAADAPIGVLDVRQSDLSDRIHELVEGYFQVVELEAGVYLWVNDDGKNIGLAPNLNAQTLWVSAHGMTDLIVGGAVLTGGIGAGGDTLGLSDAQLEHVERALGMLRVHVENTYADGHESAADYLIPAPEGEDEDAIEDWVDTELFSVTGDGYGIDKPKLGVWHEMSVLSPYSPLHGRVWEQG